jgi:signal transduction histidine kinase
MRTGANITGNMLTDREIAILRIIGEDLSSSLFILDHGGALLFHRDDEPASTIAMVRAAAPGAALRARMALARQSRGKIPVGLHPDTDQALRGHVEAVDAGEGQCLFVLRLMRAQAATAFRDVTRQLRASNDQSSKRLREAATLRQVLDATIEGVIVADQAGQVLDANAAMRRMAGDVTHLAAIFTPPDLTAITAFSQRGGGTLTMDRVTLARGGDHLTARVNLGCARLADQNILVLVFHDITDAIRLEHAERAAQLAHVEVQASRARDASKRRFLSMVSHELRTPLHGALSALELIDQKAMPDQDAVDLLHMALRSNEAALEQVNRILELTRLENHVISEARPAAFSPAEVIRSVLDQQGGFAARRGNVIKPLLRPGADRAVMGDAFLFRQIAQNLIGNALKFTENGMVFVTLEMADEAAGQVALSFSVKDTGRGFDMANRDRLLREFETGDDHYSRIEDGAGVGLALVNMAVAKMKGALAIDSRVGMGSAFTVRAVLPGAAAVPEAAGAKAPVPAPVPDHALSILVVDDHDINRAVMERQLARFGCQVALAEGGAAALAQMARQRFDVVFMDVSMPEIDGMEVTRRFRRTEAAARTLIVGLTAHAGADLHQMCREAGMDHVFVKPFRAADIGGFLADLRG